jgi:hypothetical protein
MIDLVASVCVCVDALTSLARRKKAKFALKLAR